jgi:Asp/Glu/hydantoin racemase
MPDNSSGNHLKKHGVFRLPRSNLPYYGQALGILMFDIEGRKAHEFQVNANTFTRIPGDVGNATTFKFPVQFKVMKGVFPKDVVNKSPTKETEKKIIKYTKEFEEEGVRAIGTTCGFMSYFQPAMAAAVDIPVFSSSLQQVPIVSGLIGKDKKVGIITFDARELSKEHLIRVGINDSVPIAVFGLNMLPSERNWYGISEVEPKKRLELIEDRITYAATQLVKANQDIGAILLECTNLPPAGAAVQKATGLPVFDVITLLNWAYDTVVRRRYTGFV